MGVRLRPFPSSDREFGRFARGALTELGDAATPDALQHALRARYPAAVVRAQHDLARHGEGPPTWYAFRTSAVGEALSPARPAEAWAIVDNDRRFVEVSPSLAAIVELPARHIIGRPIEAFTNPSDPTIRDDISQLWEEFVRQRRISSTVRFNFADGRPRELEYQLIADADGPGRHRLLVWVASPGERGEDPSV